MSISLGDILAARKTVRQLKLWSPLGAACLLMLVISPLAAADVITFESCAAGQTTCTEAGMTVEAAPGEFLNVQNGFGVGGSRALITGPTVASVRLSFAGEAFDAQSIVVSYVQTPPPGQINLLMITALGSSQPGALAITQMPDAPSVAGSYTFGAGFQGITALVLDSNLEFGVDNFTFRPVRSELPPEAVPEPATVVLVGTGLAGVGAAVRRRRRKGTPRCRSLSSR